MGGDRLRDRSESPGRPGKVLPSSPGPARVAHGRNPGHHRRAGSPLSGTLAHSQRNNGSQRPQYARGRTDRNLQSQISQQHVKYSARAQTQSTQHGDSPAVGVGSRLSVRLSMVEYRSHRGSLPDGREPGGRSGIDQPVALRALVESVGSFPVSTHRVGRENSFASGGGVTRVVEAPNSTCWVDAEPRLPICSRTNRIALADDP